MPPLSLLFLDVDGVLHRLNGRTFERLHILVSWLRLHPEVNLVLSSSTREYGGMARLSAALPADIRPRLVGQTPLLKNEPGSRPMKHVRQTEILQWFEASGTPATSFAVLDDDPTLFEVGWPPLVLCSSSIALKTRNLKSVEEKFKVLEGNSADSSHGATLSVSTTAVQSSESEKLDVSSSKLPVSMLRSDALGSMELPASQFDSLDKTPT